MKSGAKKKKAAGLTLGEQFRQSGEQGCSESLGTKALNVALKKNK